MTARVRISWPRGELTGRLNDGPTALKLMASLPCSSTASRWGDEVYFRAPVEAELDHDARQVVPRGTICFWVQGSSVAIPYGPTPVSVGKECRLVTAVNVIGAIEGDADLLSTVEEGDPIAVEAAESP